MNAGTVAATALLALVLSPAAAGAAVVTPQVVTPQVVTPQVVTPAPAATPAPPAPTPPPAKAAFDSAPPAEVPTPATSPTIASPDRPLPSGESPGDPTDQRPRPNRPGVYHYLPGGGVCAGFWSSCAPAYWAAQNQLNFEAMLINDLRSWLIVPVTSFFSAFSPGSSSNRDVSPGNPSGPEGGDAPSSDEGGQSVSPEEECQCSFEEEGANPLGPGGIRRLDEDPKLEQ